MAGCFFSANKGLKSPFFIGKKGENMTEINLMTSGQRLIVAQRVVVASGDIDSVKVKAVFDAAWDNYPAKTVTFYTSKDSTVYENLMIDNECTVPPEVLAESCTLFMGIRGATTDGAKIKTSSLVKYKIEPGATSGKTTLTPSMDLYQQFLAALDDKVDPFRADAYAQMDVKIAEMDAKIAETDAKIAEMDVMVRQNKIDLKDITEGDLLWENKSQDQTFAAQTIAIDTSQYKRFVIEYRRSTTTTIYGNITLYSNSSVAMGTAYRDTSNSALVDTWRICTANVNGIHFSKAYGYSGEANILIPTKIIGYKSGGIKDDDIVMDDFEI